MISQKLLQLVESLGEDVAISALESISHPADNTLTIVVDQTMHKIPEHLLLGDTYEFSRGSFDTSSEDAISSHITDCLVKLSRTLKSRNWKEVRVIVSGHAILSMYVKLLVYRVLHLETVDIAYFGQDGYKSITLNLRREVVGAA